MGSLHAHENRAISLGTEPTIGVLTIEAEHHGRELVTLLRYTFKVVTSEGITRSDVEVTLLVVADALDQKGDGQTMRRSHEFDRHGTSP